MIGLKNKKRGQKCIPF
nr:unnamed protein product [Callosobruchus analis]